MSNSLGLGKVGQALASGSGWVGGKEPHNQNHHKIAWDSLIEDHGRQLLGRLIEMEPHDDSDDRIKACKVWIAVVDSENESAVGG